LQRIIYFAPIEWDFIYQRPQHLAQRLAGTYDFYYFQPLGLRNLRISDWKRASKRVLGMVRGRNPFPYLHVKNLLFVPIINHHFQKSNLWLLRRQLAPLADGRTIVWVTTPSHLFPDLLNQIQFKSLVYEMMDDYAKIHTPIETHIKETEAWLINRADLIIATSSRLFEKGMKLNQQKKAVLIRNGVDYDFFNKCDYQRPPDLKNMGKIAGYIGTVEHWIDFETMYSLAERRVDIDFVFIGPIKIRGLPKRKNLHYLGEKKYNEIPHYCHFFDVCLIPFNPGELADSINPVKLYEYFALGKPVVSFEMKELLPFADLLYLAKDRQDFSIKLESALMENDDRMKAKRRELARLNDWSVKVRSLQQALSPLSTKNHGSEFESEVSLASRR